MYLTRVEIQNIRAIRHLVWEIAPENAAGWHVILGDNGAGKSTFVRGAVLCCIGGREAQKLEPYIIRWLRNVPTELKNDSEIRGKVKCRVTIDEMLDINFPKGLLRADIETLLYGEIGEPAHVHATRVNYTAEDGRERTFLNSNSAFIASFGSFRRFSSDFIEDSDMFESNPILRRHRTTFSEHFALVNSLKWLQQIQFKALEEDVGARGLLDNIKAFVNQSDLLPYNTQMERVRSSGVYFLDGNGASVAAEELSDGYRSVLSLLFELLRQLSFTHGQNIFETDENGVITVVLPGVVLIDEVDAHLHPTWQKRIGFWLRKHFPKMQWIVTTHSPLICQAAEKGTIYKLPTPGTDETGRMLEGVEYDRLVYGDILDAYSTNAFGEGITRSKASQEKLDRLSELNVKEIISGLTREESKEQEELRAMLPTTAAALPNEGLPV